MIEPVVRFDLAGFDLVESFGGCPELADARAPCRPVAGAGEYCVSPAWLWWVGLGGGLLLLTLAWWGWHQGGLALMQLGMGAC